MPRRRERMSDEKRNVIGSLIEMYDIKSAKDLQDALKDLLGDTRQEILETEPDEQLGYEKHEQTETPKTVKSTVGAVELDVPLDRNSEFEPKIINMYARGQTTREISEQIEDIYGFEASAELVSKITDKIIPQIEEWQNRRSS